MPAKKKTKKKAVKAVKKTTAKKAVRSTKRKPAKKVVKSSKKTKKTTTKKSSCACKKSCKPAEAFWVNNGPVVESIGGLKKAVQEMSDEQFAYHTKRNGNDFADWVQKCLCDKSCAARMKKARSRTGIVRALSGKCSCK